MGVDGGGEQHVGKLGSGEPLCHLIRIVHLLVGSRDITCHSLAAGHRQRG